MTKIFQRFGGVLLAVVMAAGGFTSCDLEEEDTGLLFLSVSPSTVFFSPGNVPQNTITVNTSSPWTVSVSDPGLVLSAMSGSAGIYTITVDGMDEGETYTATFTATRKDTDGIPVFRTVTVVTGIPEWAELPDQTSVAGLTYKTYYTDYEKPVAGKRGRNYSILYDPSQKLALWVAFPMNASTHLGKYGRPNPEPWAFDTDGDIPVSGQPAVVTGSYRESNYDRGHQIASADRSGCLAAQSQTYLTTNMTPQFWSLNQQSWADLEEAIRNVASASTTPRQDTLYIVTGPLMPARPTNYATDRNGAKCPVPDGYFKVILWSKYDLFGRKYDSVGFLFENRAYASYTMQATTTENVEARSGFTFFDNLGLTPWEMAAVKGETASWSSFSNRSTNPY